MIKQETLTSIKRVEENIKEIIEKIRKKRDLIQQGDMGDEELKQFRFLKDIQYQLEGLL